MGFGVWGLGFRIQGLVVPFASSLTLLGQIEGQRGEWMERQKGRGEVGESCWRELLEGGVREHLLVYGLGFRV